MNRIPLIKRFISLSALVLICSIILAGCGSGSQLSVEDFKYKQFGITSVLCEGGGSLYTKEANISSGEIIIESTAAYYEGSKNGKP